MSVQKTLFKSKFSIIYESILKVFTIYFLVALWFNDLFSKAIYKIFPLDMITMFDHNFGQ